MTQSVNGLGFEDLVAKAAGLGRPQIAVVVPHEREALRAVQIAEALGLARFILVGDRDCIRGLADDIGYAPADSQIIHVPDYGAATRCAVGMVRSGDASMIMKGKVPTADLVRTVLDRDAGLRTGRLLSQVVVFQIPGSDRLMLLTDAAINIAPTLAQKADICRNAIDVAHAIGIPEPKVALLAAFEFVNPDMPATVDAAALVQMNRRGQITGAVLDGPLAVDIAVSPEIAAQKGVATPISGEVDIFVAPSIEAANIFYRTLTYFAGARSGGLVVGAKVPLIILSRAETADTKIRSIALSILVEHASRQGQH